MDWYLEAWKKYAAFNGRARRKEYWTFFLFSFIVVVILTLVEGLIGLALNIDTNVLGTLYSIAVFLPSLTVGVRRLHDTNRTGWWNLILLIPIVGAIVFVVFMLQDSQPGPNRYGSNPKSELVV